MIEQELKAKRDVFGQEICRQIALPFLRSMYSSSRTKLYELLVDLYNTAWKNRDKIAKEDSNKHKEINRILANANHDYSIREKIFVAALKYYELIVRKVDLVQIDLDKGNTAKFSLEKCQKLGGKEENTNEKK